MTQTILPTAPSEIVDILTHKASIKGTDGIAAFILKGKSFKTVRPKDVSHQIFRLEDIKGLKFAFFAATGNVLDSCKTQFVSTAKRLKADYCILDAHDLARLFVAYGYICPRDATIIRGGRCSCGYSPERRTSNIMQQDALAELVRTHEVGEKSGAIILPTGAGKTRVASADIKRRESKTCLYIAHTHEILDSASEEFLKDFKPEEVTKLRNSPKPTDIKRINFITIQTLSRNLGIFEDTKVDYLVIDEFHHAAAASYKKALNRVSPKFLLGLTATPFRGDQQDVLDLCNQNVIVNYELKQGIEFGVLCPYHYYGCFDDIDYSNISHNGTNYDIRDLERALVIPERDQAIFEKWVEKADRKQTIAFCCSKRHADRVSQSFIDRGISSAVYTSDTKTDQRNRILEDFRQTGIKVLCVVDIMNEGVDLPLVECLLFLRPTESKRIFFQQLGRGLRRHLGKEFCTVIDFIGNFKNAHRTIENLGLEPYENETEKGISTGYRNSKDILNLPRGCEVHFDEKVIAVFGNQTLNPRFATRHNIARILIHQFLRVERRLGRPPKKVDLDRTCLLGSEYYVQVFGTWKDFQAVMLERSSN